MNLLLKTVKVVQRVSSANSTLARNVVLSEFLCSRRQQTCLVPTRSYESLASVCVKKAPVDLQPYLRLMRLDRPIGLYIF